MFFFKSRITTWFSIIGTFPGFSRFSDACGRAFLWRTGACIVYKSTFDFDPTRLAIRSRSNGLTDDYFYILFICFSLNKSFECLISELLTIFELFIIYRFIPQDLTWRNINARKKLTALKIYSRIHYGPSNSMSKLIISSLWTSIMLSWVFTSAKIQGIFKVL